jgi:hypothetical protein
MGLSEHAHGPVENRAIRKHAFAWQGLTDLLSNAEVKVKINTCLLKQILITATGSAIGAGTGLFYHGKFAGAGGAVAGGLIAYLVAPACFELKPAQHPPAPIAKRELPPGGRPPSYSLPK